jgi:hypothetical protein
MTWELGTPLPPPIVSNSRNGIAVGKDAWIDGEGAIAIGAYAVAAGDGAMAFGYRAMARGKGAFAMGDGACAIGDGAVDIRTGRGIMTQEQVTELRHLVVSIFGSDQAIVHQKLRDFVTQQTITADVESQRVCDAIVQEFGLVWPTPIKFPK